MKITYWMAVGLIFSTIRLNAEDWTVDGKDYHNVKVTSVAGDSVAVTYDGGMGHFNLADLTPDLKKRFDYDPAKAVAAIQKREEDHREVAQLWASVGPALNWNEITEKPLVKWAQEIKREEIAASNQGDKNRVALQKYRLQIFHEMLLDKRIQEVSEEIIQNWIDCVMTDKICAGMPRLLVVMAWGPPQSSTTSTGTYGNDFESMNYSNLASIVSISGGYVSDITQTTTNY